MEYIGVIASVIAAIAAVLTLFATVSNTKANIYKRINHKERQISEIENRLCRKYGLSRMHTVMTPLDKKKEKLQVEIDELQRRL